MWNNVVSRIYSHKGLVYITAGNLLGSALTGTFWLLLASIQSAHEYGVTNYEISLASLFASAALLGLNTTVVTYLAKGTRKINVQANQLILISGGLAAIIVSFHNWILSPFVIAMTFWMIFFSMVPISFYQYLIPEHSSGSGKKTSLPISGIFLSLILTVLMFISAPWIIETFFPSYTESLSAVRILSLGILPMIFLLTETQDS
jgi:hypothetical protein